MGAFYFKKEIEAGPLRRGPGGTSGTGFFRGARNFWNSAHYIIQRWKNI